MRRKEMPLIIPSTLVVYAQSITMDIDFNRFTDTQIKNVVKQVRRGCISKGNSMTAHLARYLMKGHDYTHFLYDSYSIKWVGINNGHPFFTTLKEVASLAKLDEKLSEWYRDSLDTMIQVSETQEEKGSIYAYHIPREYLRVLKKSMLVEQELPHEVEEFLNKLQSRTLGVVPISVHAFK